MHAVYLAIFELPFNIQRKTTLLTALMGGADWSWRVTGITAEALEVLASNDFKYAKGKICRAHLIDRIDTAGAVFQIPSPLTEDQFFAKIWENDETVIATKSENKTRGTLPKIILIDYKLGLFVCNPLVGFRYGKRETGFLRELHANHKSGAAK